MESEGEGTTAKNLNGPVQLSDSFSRITLASVPDLVALENGSSGVVDAYPATDGVDRELFECVGER